MLDLVVNRTVLAARVIVPLLAAAASRVQAQVGACCLPNGVCLQTTQAGCTSMFGLYRGDGSPCPPSCFGACCSTIWPPDCAQVLATGCPTIGAVYLGEGSSCASCPPVVGLCCLRTHAGGCSTVTQAECEAHAGHWVGGGLACGNCVEIYACYPNCDDSTTAPILNVQDFNCFLNKFNAGDTYANCDHSTTAPTLNIQDFTCFLNKFATGCP